MINNKFDDNTIIEKVENNFNYSCKSIQKNQMIKKSIYSKIYSGILDNNELVCIKTINRQYLTLIEYNMFYNEIQINQMLKSYNHDNIINYKGYSCSKNYIDLIFELGNNTLDDLIMNNPLEIQNNFKKYIIEILTGLKFLHDKNIIHGDIKGDNILIINNKIKICDFGISIINNNNNNKLLNHIGTHPYIAPEVIKDLTISCKSDMWAFGALLYKIINNGYDIQFTIKNENNIKKLINYCGEWNDLLEKCLKINPDERISSEKALEYVRLKYEANI